MSDEAFEMEDKETAASDEGSTSEMDSGTRYMLASNPPSTDNSTTSAHYSTFERLSCVGFFSSSISYLFLICFSCGMFN